MNGKNKTYMLKFNYFQLSYEVIFNVAFFRTSVFTLYFKNIAVFTPQDF